MAAQATFSPSKLTLIDIPVSNNGGRIRWLLYKCNLEAEVDIAPPKVLGEHKNQLNPTGKIPMLILPDGSCLPESEVIMEYLVERFPEQTRALVPSTPEQRAKSRIPPRLLDVYVTPIQACMYRKMDDPQQRAAQIQDINKQLGILEHWIQDEGPFILGKQISYADGCLFPTLTFMEFMLPEFFGWSQLYKGRPKLEAHMRAMLEDVSGARVAGEITANLQKWKADGRWDSLGITQQIKENPDLNWACK